MSKLNNKENKKMKDGLIYIFLLCIIGVLSFSLYKANKESEEHLTTIQTINEEGKYSQLYYDKSIESLKKLNRSLYDSLEYYKDEVNYLIQFKYSKNYSTGTVQISSKPSDDKILTDTVKGQEKPNIATYEYSNGPNDSINYTLRIGSTVEPHWYSLDLNVNDKFTIVNRNVNGLNNITMVSDNKGTFTDVTTVNVKKKDSFWDRFAIGPSVTAGYNLNSRNFDVMVGVSVTYDLTNVLKRK